MSLTTADRKSIIDTGIEHSWTLAFGISHDAFYFHRKGVHRYLEVYFNQDGDLITEAWSDLGRAEPDLAWLLDHLTKRGST